MVFCPEARSFLIREPSDLGASGNRALVFESAFVGALRGGGSLDSSALHVLHTLRSRSQLLPARDLGCVLHQASVTVNFHRTEGLFNAVLKDHLRSYFFWI